MNNTVELLGYYGGDKTHCLSAWTSTCQELGIDLPASLPDRVDTLFEYVAATKKKTPDELLEMLATAGHHTPFEKSLLHFQVDTDIASHIHILKHRIGVSVNAESARYKELMEDKMYIPEDWNIPVDDIFLTQVSRNTIRIQLDRRPVQNMPTWGELLEAYTAFGNQLYHRALKELEEPLGRKRAKESARYFKTYNSQLVSDVSFNWRSFYHFQKLRNDSHAQLEIREVAQRMLGLVKALPGDPFGLTIQAFGL